MKNTSRVRYFIKTKDASNAEVLKRYNMTAMNHLSDGKFVWCLSQLRGFIDNEHDQFRKKFSNHKQALETIT